MARQKLTIVVTCTDRKTGAPHHDLMARTLPTGTVKERADDWVGRLRATRPTTRLLDLYAGESWTQAKRLAATARSTGFQPEVFVASAGLGLRPVDDVAPPYAATFATGHRDSVVQATPDASVWWKQLAHAAGPRADAPSIWVLSESYARAMTDDLQALDPQSTVVFGGASDTPASLRIRSDRNLRGALGGTITSLNARMAIRWLEIADGKMPAAPEVHRNWATWALGAQQQERYDRKPVSDHAIKQMIDQMRGLNPKLPKTVALRNLRNSGIACEQRRFTRLFEEALTS
ncbi:hypothetical protein GCM10009868_26510 [Terrabacter aerolatus]|uniref:Uncharacterized protein n=1 Tax=Terrabacter aerolatus TaxID=422442 RepID=A0A512D5G8_9MICO|nr:hypothetical protein [Terrabacter aerolatus]GEO31677.1 hypothetical protein TAE01_34870 [Terrabacter aerolatus]